MNSRQRFKLGAGAGLVTMLLGALMVLAPGAGADDESVPVAAPPSAVVRGNQACPPGTTDFKIDPPDLSGATVSETRNVVLPGDTSTTAVTITYTAYVPQGGTARHFDWTSSHGVARVIVKQGPDSALFDYNPAALLGTVYVALVDGTKASPLGTSHISFCLGSTPPPPPPATGSITVDKQVTGLGQPTTDPAYGFTVSCMLGNEMVTLDPDEAAFTLTKDAPAKVIGGLPVGTVCTVTEPEAERNGASTTTYTVEAGTPTATPAIATVVELDPADVVVTTDCPAPPTTGDLTVTKIAGANAPATSPAFSFSVECDINEDPVDPDPSTDAMVETFDLAFGASKTFEDLADGVSCDVTEFGKGGAQSTTYTVNAGAAQTGDTAVGVAIAAGQVTTVAFTNNFRGEIPPPPPPPPGDAPEANLRIVKDVDGDVPDDWTATFRGVPGNTLQTFQLSEGDDTEAFLEIAPGTYRVRELGSIDSELVGIDCEGTTGWEEDGDAVEVTLVDGDDVTCTFTNFYPEEQVLPEEEEPGSITIVKDVEGWEPALGWSFGFTGSNGIGRFVLSDDDASTTFETLEAGSYTFAEDGNSETTLSSIECDDDQVVTDGRSVTVDLDEGEAVTCTFTNAFRPAAQVVPDVEVKGDVVTRTLPRTGDETRGLAGVGAFMLALGAVMVLGSRRQLARR